MSAPGRCRAMATEKMKCTCQRFVEREAAGKVEEG
jgi:hypothetical protein